jgi:superfamily I DNA/RNA helicase
MSVPALTLTDLAELSVVFPDLDFSDPERQATLLEAGTRDVHAAPGSGKTTLVAAKLYLLLKKWPHERRGICVISHTNVASEEITRRLMATSEGARLLSYPHYIGTIHAFVNKFLALPYMHSRGIPVETIDSEAFAKRAIQLARRDSVLLKWLNSPSGTNAENVIKSLCYQGKDLTLGPLRGDMVKKEANSYQPLHDLKAALTAEGVHLYEDALNYAKSVLLNSPQQQHLLSHRFPLVLLDEMQDTSVEQESLLSLMFNSSVVTQRFGDQNQRIFSDYTADESSLTFPKAGRIDITTSKRFSAEIANAASTMQIQGKPIVGVGPSPVAAPTIILYRTHAVEKVIPYFGKLVLNSFSDDELRRGSVKAIAARKQSGANVIKGRHLGDYWPAYGGQNSTSISTKDLAWTLLADHKNVGRSAHGLHSRVRNVQRLLLLILKATAPNLVAGINDDTKLLRTLEGQGIDIRRLRHARYLLTIRTNLSGKWSKVRDFCFEAVKEHLPAKFTQEQFINLPIFEVPTIQGAAAAGKSENECVVQHNDRELRIQLSTVALAKGETHLATLYLESYVYPSNKFDLAKGLTELCGATPLDPAMSNELKGLYRNMYVGMSRPSQMLCLAMNKERADALHVARLKAGGWAVHELT